MEWRNW